MIAVRPAKKGFFARYWGWFLGGFLFLCIAGAGLLFLLLHSFFFGSAKVTDLSLSADSVVVGDQASASVTVENTGLLPLKYHGSVLIDGDATPLPAITLGFHDPQTLTLDLSGLVSGSHTVSVGDLEKTLKVLRPAEIKVTDLTVSPDKVFVNDKVTATATFTNTGEVAGNLDGAFTYDGVALDSGSVSVKLDPGEGKTVTADFTVKSRGTHTIALFDRQSTITAVSRASVSLTDLAVSKDLAKPGETVTVKATLQNTGDEDGQYALNLTINGKTFKKQTVAVKGNGTVTVTFSVSEKSGGSYVIKAGDFSKTLRVVNITRPKNGTLFVKKANGGYGKFTIVNGYSADVVLTLASVSNPKAALLTVYLRAGAKVSNIRVKDGTYAVFYSTGSNYDSFSKKFITDPSYYRSDKPLAFKTARSYYSTTYTIWTLTLNAANGDSIPESVDEGDFPN